MNDKINQFGDFTNQTKAILEKMELQKPIKKLKILHPVVIIIGFLFLMIPTVLYLLGFKAAIYILLSAVIGFVGGIVLPVYSVLRKERVCMLTYVVSYLFSVIITWVMSTILNYYLYIMNVVVEKGMPSGLFLNMGWPFIPMAIIMLVFSIFSYLCLKRRISSYSFEPKYVETDDND